MNVFIAGVHAVGKSYLCKEFSSIHGWMHRSASQLIREELGSGNWSIDKRVDDAENNQRALVGAVQRINANQDRLLLDGHFVLKDKTDKFIRLGTNVFSALSLSGVILIEAAPELIISRLIDRDSVIRGAEEIRHFISAERDQAAMVCSALGIPLIVLKEPTLADFTENILRISAV